ncbi:hypothetical protein B5S28_g2644 [[Candida] boidinii]|uniref:Unnamed protein product n=1 Tax=Candida boidinii TaxID=5477 RepID=A0ACB5THJ7_CANBO|nr:hypothetical protein B5S28_g2644 [[Candida] boidinii]OWB60099.1 hypothetical protein B5S29_g967 [[Candida] boidinii]OWB74719.1 hypothetical protein B5S31_g4535 [[Candida] boidinii]OWB80587.1 hypothetical protein B5S32_g4875 [[Candida] boidinii]GME88726.1 unnamed protein product [[Candida] boidinii]
MLFGIVTGANGGIGIALTRELCKNGYYIFAISRNDNDLKDLKYTSPEIADFFEIIKCDLNNDNEIQKLYEKIMVKTNNKLDLLYHNAGVSFTKSVIDLSNDELIKSYNVNLFAPMKITKIFSKSLIKNKGTICFTSSVASFVPLPFTGAYCSSKAALNQYANNLSLELGGFGVKVLNFITGLIDTKFVDIKDDDLKFPSNSVFATIPESSYILKNKAKAQTDKKGQNPNDYAKSCVNSILEVNHDCLIKDKRQTGSVHFFKPFQAIIIYIAYWLLPTSLFRALVYKTYGLDDFFQTFDEERNSIKL